MAGLPTSTISKSNSFRPRPKASLEVPGSTGTQHGIYSGRSGQRRSFAADSGAHELATGSTLRPTRLLLHQREGGYLCVTWPIPARGGGAHRQSAVLPTLPRVRPRPLEIGLAGR